MPVRQSYDPLGHRPVAHQSVVNSHFRKAASYWAEVYDRRDDVDAAIFQERLRRVLELVDSIAVPRQAPVLEVGCGAGFATVALAGRGFVVEAVDAEQSMVDTTRSTLASNGLERAVHTCLGDIHALSFADESFDLVVAVGVLDWFPSMERPVREIARVLRPGGYSIVTMDNRWGMRQFVEPYTNPILRPAKRALKQLLRRSKRNGGRALTYVASLHETDATLHGAGLEKVRGLTLGFGPFRIFNRAVLPNSVGLSVHNRLQHLSDRGIPILRSCGGQYIVLARKRARTTPCAGTTSMPR